MIWWEKDVHYRENVRLLSCSVGWVMTIRSFEVDDDYWVFWSR